MLTIKYEPQPGDSSLKLMVHIAETHPHCTFTLWRYDIGDGYDKTDDNNRVAYLCRGAEFLSKFQEVNDRLGETEEIGVSNRVDSSSFDQPVYLPFVDFKVAQDWDQGKEAAKVLEKLGDMYLYNSGNSLHGYGLLPLYGDLRYVGFMGKMLLITTPGDEVDVIDTRWVGRRLVAGDSVLRLTANCKERAYAPCYVGKLSAVGNNTDF